METIYRKELKTPGWLGCKIVIVELILVLDIYQLILLSIRLHCICRSTFFAPNYDFFPSFKSLLLGRRRSRNSRHD